MTGRSNLETILQEKFKLSTFRKGQLDILESVLEGSDVLAVMPTGGGKSLCFQLPSLVNTGIVIVVSPLISLMRDQVARLQELGIAAGCLYSGQTLAEKRLVFDQMKASAQFLLYLSPERVQKPSFASWLRQQKLSLFAIDEAHCISQWGPDFRPEYHQLKLLRSIRPDIPILAATATATPQVLMDITRQLQLRNPRRHVYGFYRPNLFYQVEACEAEEVKIALLRSALRQFVEGRVIVYCGTRKQSEELTEMLRDEFQSVDFYHAGLETKERNKVQLDYDQGRTRILLATNAFGMGIDHPDVRLIVHYQMPATIESYYQEIGRAGRDGKDSTCLLCYSKKDKGLLSFFIRESKAEPQVIRSRWRALDAITQYAEGGDCRHSEVLTYFQDRFRLEKCGHCDVCAPDSPRKISRPLMPILVPTAKLKMKKAFDFETPLTAEQELRYEVVRQWRHEYAKSKDIAAFMVFSNKTLRDLVVKNPKTKSELSEVYGFGSARVDHLGEEVLKQLAQLR